MALVIFTKEYSSDRPHAVVYKHTRSISEAIVDSFRELDLRENDANYVNGPMLCF